MSLFAALLIAAAKSAEVALPYAFARMYSRTPFWNRSGPTYCSSMRSTEAPLL